MRARSPQHRLRGVGTAGVVVLFASSAMAQSALPSVTVDGSCPSASSVQSVLRSVSMTHDASAQPSADAATIVDRGDTYVVTVRGRTKTYVDPDRRCEERARISATFIALVLEPASAPPEQEVEQAPKSSVTTASAPPSPGPASRVQTEASPASSRAEASAASSRAETWVRADARGAIAVSDEAGLVAPGAALSFEMGWGAFGGEASCAWLASTAMSLTARGTAAHFERFPCAVGPVARWLPASWLEMQLKLGLALGALRVTGEGAGATYSSVRLELGGRVGIDARFRVSPHARVAPVVGLEMTYEPSTYDLVVVPRGVVARTPDVWAGATAGVCWNGW